ncbi:MAG: GNAT family N-acetyltransferase [Oscillospiraceae bacterium]|jgi:GNAT superfamily N-acetyltransferase|nr:GNAT family N-acetyltransferase [Oscillospiraceae bacterium]
MTVISIREQPEYAQDAIRFFQKHWATQYSERVYEDCILNCLDSPSPLPQWYLLHDNGQIIGGAGLITNDFISRMDLYPWLCALYIEKPCRGHAHGSLLIEHIKKQAKQSGYGQLYLCTDHVGYYERYGFAYLAQGYHPWGGCSRIYQAKL